jgi:hypothetical protein
MLGNRLQQQRSPENLGFREAFSRQKSSDFSGGESPYT